MTQSGRASAREESALMKNTIAGTIRVIRQFSEIERVDTVVSLIQNTRSRRRFCALDHSRAVFCEQAKTLSVLRSNVGLSENSSCCYHGIDSSSADSTGTVP